MKPQSTYGIDDRARQFAYEAISQCMHVFAPPHPLSEYGACVDCITEMIHSIVEEVKAAERERCADIAEMWDWRKSGDMTNDHIAAAIRASTEEATE